MLTIMKKQVLLEQFDRTENEIISLELSMLYHHFDIKIHSSRSPMKNDVNFLMKWWNIPLSQFFMIKFDSSIPRFPDLSTTEPGARQFSVVKL